MIGCAMKSGSPRSPNVRRSSVPSSFFLRLTVAPLFATARRICSARRVPPSQINVSVPGTNLRQSVLPIAIAAFYGLRDSLPPGPLCASGVTTVRCARSAGRTLSNVSLPESQATYTARSPHRAVPHGRAVTHAVLPTPLLPYSTALMRAAGASSPGNMANSGAFTAGIGIGGLIGATGEIINPPHLLVLADYRMGIDLPFLWYSQCRFHLYARSYDRIPTIQTDHSYSSITPMFYDGYDE